MNVNKKIKEYMDTYTELWPFSGTVVVLKDGEVLFNKSYGYASIEHKVKNSDKTIYKIASLTKQMTCMAIMILKEQGLINVDDPVKKFFPDYQQLDERITVKHLMTHTSGLFNDFSVVDPHLMLGKRLCSHKEIFDVFMDMPLEFEPGKGWSYCYFGYYLLGVIIERVSGKSYSDFLKENIFNPLGMKNTGLDDYIEILPGKASGYYASGERVICSEIDTMSAFSSGAIYSTIEDMILWDQALYNNSLVTKDTKNEIFTPFKNNYSYGWIVDENHNRKRVRHSGGGNGYSHQYHRYLEDQVSILILSNYGFANSLTINETIANIVFNEGYSFPKKPEVFSLDLSIYDRYVGVYGEGLMKHEVKRDGEQLYFVMQNKWVMPIYPISEHTFHHTWIDKTYTIKKTEDGEYTFNGIKKIVK